MRGGAKIQGQEFYPLDLDRLPAGWTWSMVGEVATEIRSGFASGRHNANGVGVPHLRPMNIDRDGRVDLSEVKSVSPENPLRVAVGDVLFNNTNSPALIGKTTAITREGDWAFSNHMTRLRFPASVEPRFAAVQLHFLWMTQYFRHRCVNHVNQASISGSMLGKSVPFVVPPRGEQDRIVAEIEKQFTRLDAGVAALERLQAHIRRYRAAVLKAACDGTLLSGSQANVPIDAPSDRPLPAGWTSVTLSECAEIIVDCAHSTPKWTESGRICVRTTEFCVAGLRLDGNLRYVSEATFKERTARLLPRAGDVLYSREGAILGIACVVPSRVELCMGQRMMLIRPRRGVDGRFLAAVLNSPQTASVVKRMTGGSASPHVNVRDVKSFFVPLPNESEQSRIADEVERHYSLIAHQESLTETTLSRALRLRAAILSAAFEGRLVAPPEQPARAPAA